MECMDRDTIGILTDHSGETCSHILRGIVRECETEYIAREVVSRREDIRDASREEFSLSASWSCDDEDWTVDGIYSFFLLSIEFIVSFCKSHESMI